MDNSVVMNNGRKEYTITWFVENYSYCWHKKGESLISPKLTFASLESTVWTLQLCPRGSFIANKGNISLYLNRSVVDESPGYVPQKYELAVLAADGQSALHSVEREFKRNPLFGHGVSEFLRIDEVLLRQKAN
ncbi:hypothetical protein AVEN_210350-1, partial [Araneus ventricosus]